MRSGEIAYGGPEAAEKRVSGEDAISSSPPLGRPDFRKPSWPRTKLVVRFTASKNELRRNRHRLDLRSWPRSWAGVLDLWMNVVASHVKHQRTKTILDLGCGTGRFSEALAMRFEAEVIGIDPSKKMLAQARSKPSRGRVRYERGRGESIPLPDNSVDLVFMSMIFHHFDTPGLAALECRRVLRDGGTAIVRTGISERIS